MGFIPTCLNLRWDPTIFSNPILSLIIVFLILCNCLSIEHFKFLAIYKLLCAAFNWKVIICEDLEWYQIEVSALIIYTHNCLLFFMVGIYWSTCLTYFVAEVTHCKQADIDFRGHEEICSESGGVMDYEEDRSRPKR